MGLILDALLGNRLSSTPYEPGSSDCTKPGSRQAYNQDWYKVTVGEMSLREFDRNKLNGKYR